MKRGQRNVKKEEESDRKAAIKLGKPLQQAESKAMLRRYWIETLQDKG